MKEKIIPAIFIFLCILLISGVIYCIVFNTTHSDEIGTSLWHGWYYAKSARVVEIDRDADVVTFEDCMGNLWEWEGVEDWEINDNAALLMNSKGTEKIFDDEIISAKFENWG